jgi:hyperosmotically inducible periplasmic protein
MRYSIAAGIVASVVVIAGCDRPRSGETSSKGTPSPEVQAERKLENAVAALDDATVTAKVKTALIADPGIKGMAIDVDTAQNVVTLSGTVASEDARKQAERIARQTEGVKEVKNNLNIKAAS